MQSKQVWLQLIQFGSYVLGIQMHWFTNVNTLLSGQPLQLFPLIQVEHPAAQGKQDLLNPLSQNPERHTQFDKFASFRVVVSHVSQVKPDEQVKHL